MTARRALIVCEDDRWKELARVLSGSFVVYARNCDNDDIEWRWYSWRDKSVVDLPSAPSSDEPFDVLFFHKSDPDGGIPAGFKFQTEFVFSSPGVTTGETAKNRSAAIPIQRGFPLKGCPLWPRHIHGLTEFIDKKDRDLCEPPAFCRHEEIHVLSALAIVCKTYAACGIANCSIEFDEPLVKSLGWQKEECQAIVNASHNLRKFWPSMQNIAWWQKHLGYYDVGGRMVDESKYQSFLAQLILELEFDGSAKKELGMKDAESLAKKSSHELLGLICDLKDVSELNIQGVVSLLRVSVVSSAVVTNAYQELALILAQR